MNLGLILSMEPVIWGMVLVLVCWKCFNLSCLPYNNWIAAQGVMDSLIQIRVFFDNEYFMQGFPSHRPCPVPTTPGMDIMAFLFSLRTSSIPFVAIRFPFYEIPKFSLVHEIESMGKIAKPKSSKNTFFIRLMGIIFIISQLL